LQNLIRNEWMKLWHKKATWIMLAILVIILLGVAGITKYVSTNKEQAEQPSIEENQQMLEAQLAAPELDPGTKKQLQEELKMIEYQIDNDIEKFDPNGAEQYVLDSYSMLAMVTLFSVIAAASIVASEFSQGTIKMLLSRPVKRWKILTSKYVTSILYALFLSVVAIIATAIAGYLLFDSSGGTLLSVVDGKVIEESYWGKVLTLYGLQFVSIFIYTTFAFMIGSVFRSSSLAIGLSIFLMFAGSNIVYFLRDYEIAKYILFTHTELTMYETGFTLVEGITMPFSVAVLSVYVVLFLIISYLTFTKRDITA
jgi:ABC-2 type transport system permease protein